MFTFEPTFVVYKWTKKNEVYLNGTPRSISIGGGGGGAAFSIDGTLLNGGSNKSETYGNDCLASSESFKCVALEVWSLGKVKGDTESVIGTLDQFDLATDRGDFQSSLRSERAQRSAETDDIRRRTALT